MIRLALFIILLLPPFLCHSSEPRARLDTPDKLHTFFTSPDTRLQLDKYRDAGKFTSPADLTSTALFFNKPLTVQMQGVMIRENGESVVFVNKGNTLQSPLIDNHIKVLQSNIRDNNFKIPLRINQQAVTLKPGQQWNESAGNVQDNFQIKPPIPASEGQTEAVISKIIN